MEIAKGIHLLETSKGSFSYLVLDEEPVLIDTGMPGRFPRLMAELSELGVRPSDIAHILLTHHDVDHIGNAEQLQTATGATLWASEGDLPYIHGDVSRPGIKRIIGTLVRPKRPEVDRTYQAGQKIGSLEVIPTPGHTPGHVSLLYGDILFAGDLVTTSKGRIKPSPSVMTWDKAQLRSSLKTVGKMNFDWVCPAHGRPVHRENMWDAFMEY